MKSNTGKDLWKPEEIRTLKSGYLAGTDQTALSGGGR